MQRSAAFSLAYSAMVTRLALQQSLGCQSVAYLAFGSDFPYAHLHLVPHDDPNTVLEPLKHVRTRTSEQLKRDAHRRSGSVDLRHRTEWSSQGAPPQRGIALRSLL